MIDFFFMFVNFAVDVKETLICLAQIIYKFCAVMHYQFFIVFTCIAEPVCIMYFDVMMTFGSTLTCLIFTVPHTAEY